LSSYSSEPAYHRLSLLKNFLVEKLRWTLEMPQLEFLDAGSYRLH
jgi:hypothetical protein